MVDELRKLAAQEMTLLSSALTSHTPPPAICYLPGIRLRARSKTDERARAIEQQRAAGGSKYGSSIK